MLEEVERDLDTLNDYDEIFHYLENLIENSFDFDGLTVVIYNKAEEKYIILTEDLQWRDMKSLPESLIHTCFEKKLPQSIVLGDDITCNINLDCFGEDSVSGLLLYPITGKSKSMDVVFAIRKKYKKEKDEVMEPLIVGSQKVGVTTRVKNTYIPQVFNEDDLQYLHGIEEELLAIVEKLINQITLQKEAVLKQVKEDEKVFNTPQEIIATLVNILMGTNASINNLKDILKQIREQLHHNDKIIPQIKLMQEIVETLDQNLVNTFQFSTKNSMLQELFKGKERIETEKFFEYFSIYGHDIICEKNLALNFFLDPSLPQEVKIERQSTYIFLTEILQFAFNDVNKDANFNINISLKKNEKMVLFAISYDAEVLEAQTYRNMFIGDTENHPLKQSIKLSYKKFIQVGGKVAISVDTKKVTFNIKIPFEESSPRPLALPIGKNNIKIGILLHKEKDFLSANTVARYLLALGISKSQIKGAEDINLFKNDISHLIIFQSRFSQELFNETLQETPYHIMIMTDSCPKKDHVTFYNYSVVDMEIDKNRFYLSDLKDFIRLEYE